EGAHALEERVEERDSATEAVEKWERGEDQIGFPGVERDGELGDVAQDIAMAEDHALRFARAATGEKEDRFGMIPDARQLQHSAEQCLRHDERCDPPEKDLL